MPSRRLLPDQLSENSKGHRRVVDPAGPLLVEPPPAAKQWLAVTNEDYAFFWETPNARLIDRVHLPVLMRLFDLRDMAERRRRDYEAEPIVAGSTGQLTAHPAAKLMQAHQAEARALEDRLGMTLTALHRMGVSFASQDRSSTAPVWDPSDDDEIPDPRLQAVGDD